MVGCATTHASGGSLGGAVPALFLRFLAFSPEFASRSGAVVFAQRFGSALNHNGHLHALVLDGAFVSPSSALAPIAPALIVTPPAGLEIGHVPIAIRPERKPTPRDGRMARDAARGMLASCA